MRPFEPSAHGLQQRADADRFFVMLDLESAPNFVDRCCFLLGIITQVASSLTVWCDTCYAEPIFVFFWHGEKSARARGVQQGDRLGLLLFALALHGAHWTWPLFSPLEKTWTTVRHAAPRGCPRPVWRPQPLRRDWSFKLPGAAFGSSSP